MDGKMDEQAQKRVDHLIALVTSACEHTGMSAEATEAAVRKVRDFLTLTPSEIGDLLDGLALLFSLLGLYETAGFLRKAVGTYAAETRQRAAEQQSRDAGDEPLPS